MCFWGLLGGYFPVFFVANLIRSCLFYVAFLYWSEMGFSKRSYIFSSLGFSLTSGVLLVCCWGVFFLIAWPTCLEIWNDAKLREERRNIRLLEEAKLRWSVDNPGLPLRTLSSLSRYFPGGILPRTPWGGSYEEKDENGEYLYRDLLDLDRPMASPRSPPGFLVSETSSDFERERATGFMSPTAPNPIPFGPALRPPDPVGLGDEVLEEKSGGDPWLSSSEVVRVGYPVVSFFVDPQRGPRGERFVFRAEGFDPQNSPLEYSFNGGEYQRSSSLGVTFKSLGRKEVSVVVRNAQGLESPRVVAEVEVINLAPSVVLEASNREVNLGNSVQFYARGLDPDGDLLEYSFDGGAWTKSPLVERRPIKEGFYGVKVIARDSYGAQSEQVESGVVVQSAFGQSAFGGGLP